MNIDELKALQPLIAEFEATENQLACFHEYGGDISVAAIEWQPHLGPGRAPGNHVRLKNSEIIDTVIDLLERRLERLRAALRAAGVEDPPEPEGALRQGVKRGFHTLWRAGF
jgi:hypothetical protein